MNALLDKIRLIFLYKDINNDSTMRFATVYTLSGDPHDDVMTWQRFLHYWPFVRGIYR